MLIAMIRSNARLRDTATQVQSHVRCELFSRSSEREETVSRAVISFYGYPDRVRRKSSIFFHRRPREYQLRAGCLSFGNFLRHEFLCVRVYWQITRCFWFFFLLLGFFLPFSRRDPGVIFKLNRAIFVDDKPLCEEYRQACWISTLLCLCRIQPAISIDVVYRWEKFTRAFAHVRFSAEFHRSIANTCYRIYSFVEPFARTV